MNEKKLDSLMSEYFSAKTAPSPETRAVLYKKLVASYNKKAALYCWFVLFLVTIFSVMCITAIWFITSDEIITSTGAAYFAFSILSGSVTVVACRRKKFKGDIGNDIFNN